MHRQLQVLYYQCDALILHVFVTCFPDAMLHARAMLLLDTLPLRMFKKNPFSMHTSKNNPWTHACIKSRSQYECTTEKRREEWTNEWMIEWLDEGIKEWRNEGKKEWRNERRKEWRKEGMREWMNEGITERMNGGMNERKNEEMNQWINETQMHWINGSIRW